MLAFHLHLQCSAYLNYVFFDQDFNFISGSSNYKQISTAAEDAHELLEFNGLVMPEAGYLFIYVSNEGHTSTGGNVYFDDLRIAHKNGPIIQEDHYYPFGLSINALSSSAPLSKPNNFKYNGKEEQTDFDINIYDYGARNYDAQIGRWFNIDPLANSYSAISPYVYTANNPARFIDPDGMRIGDGLEYFNLYRDQVNDKIKKHGEITRGYMDQMVAALKGGETKKANKFADKATAEAKIIEELEGVNRELDALVESDQLYNIYTNSVDVEEDAVGNAQYDIASDALNVNLKNGYHIGTIAHELKHAYQFETGALSYGTDGSSGGALYDLQGEVEAYARGVLFGDSRDPSFAQLKKDYKTIRTRTTQLTLDTTTGTYAGAPSMGEQMRARTAISFKNKTPIIEYYRNWRMYFK